MVSEKKVYENMVFVQVVDGNKETTTIAHVEALLQNDTSNTTLWKRQELDDGKSSFRREKCGPSGKLACVPTFIGKDHEF